MSELRIFCNILIFGHEFGFKILLVQITIKQRQSPTNWSVFLPPSACRNRKVVKCLRRLARTSLELLGGMCDVSIGHTSPPLG